MIIVPTEKQINWKNAPVVLCILVFINVMMFFFYQSGDNRKIHEAMVSYHERNLLVHEWPLFEKYLEETELTDTLASYRVQLKQGVVEHVIQHILMDEEFYDYLMANYEESFESSFYHQWLPIRKNLHEQVHSTSASANGLRPSEKRISTFFTYQFLHGDTMHLLGNMFFLIICGFAVEAAIGHLRFLIFYILSGIAAGLAHVALNLESTAPLIGASGSVSGVMAMYLVVFRLKKIEFFYWFYFFVGYFRAPALLILPLFIGKEVYSFYSDPESSVAFMAHAGGFVAGALLIALAWLVNRDMLNIEYIETDQSIDQRQQQLADIYACIEKHQFDKALVSVNALIAEEGLAFDLATLRYNLLKISRGEEYLPATLELLSMPLLGTDNVQKLDAVWRDNPDVHAQLPEQTALKLGMQLTALDNPQSAEQLFKQLLERGCKDPSLSIYARKLSEEFVRLRDSGKHKHYAALADQLTQGATHGLL